MNYENWTKDIKDVMIETSDHYFKMSSLAKMILNWLCTK